MLSIHNSAMVTEIHLLLYHGANKQMHTDLRWVSGHSGIVGTESAGSSAKSATTSVDRQASTREVPHTDMTGWSPMSNRLMIVIM